MSSDRQFMQICLVFAVLGIMLLGLTVYFTEPEKIAAGDITDKMTGHIIESRITIGTIFVKDGIIFIDTEENPDLSVIMFENNAKKQPEVYELKPGASVTVRGKVSIYKGGLEIIADRIICEEPVVLASHISPVVI